MSKFAPMTSQLLVRKGAAEPSLVAQGDKSALFWSQPHAEPRIENEPPPVATSPRPTFPAPKLQSVAVHDDKHDERKAAEQSSDRHRKISVSLSDREHEALGIAAVKLGVTRNHLVRDALDALLQSLERQYGGKCKCIADGSVKETCCQNQTSTSN
ncbi:MAG: hypothetical protein HY243_02520 [Proteobacteria bacterium]|nr:hypothetical protein [Pseudomonadota bacterium]